LKHLYIEKCRNIKLSGKIPDMRWRYQNRVHYLPSTAIFLIYNEILEYIGYSSARQVGLV